MTEIFGAGEIRGAILWLLFLAMLPGCGEQAETQDASGAGRFDLTDIPLSADLRPFIAEGRAFLDGPGGTGSAVADLERYRALIVGIQRMKTRQAAGDTLYLLWRDNPAHFLWIDLAVRYNHLLRRTEERNAICALVDTASAVDAFIRGRRFYRHGSRGEHYRRAERGLTRLDSLQQIWLERRLAMVDSDAGDHLGALTRLLARLPGARTLGGALLEHYLWLDIATILLRDDRLDDALHAAALSGALARHGDCDHCELEARTTLARILAARRESTAALELWEDCMEIAAARSFPWLYRRSADLAASLCGSLGQLRLALHFDRQIHRYNLAVADSINTPRNLVNIADDFRRLGQLDSCRVYLQRARTWVGMFPSRRNRALLPRYEAEYYCQIGDYATADSLLAQASAGLTLATLAHDEAELLLELIQQGLETAQPDVAYRAIDRLKELRAVLYDSAPDQNLVAEFEIATADFLARQGEFGLATEALARAHRAVTSGGGAGPKWEHRRSAGELALIRGDLTSAHEYFTDCLDLTRQEANPDRLARSRFHLGRVLLREGRVREARSLFREQIADTAYGGRFRTRLASRLFLGLTYAHELRHQEALTHYSRVADLCSRRTPADLLARLQLETGRSRSALGQTTEAVAAFQQSLALLPEQVGEAQPGKLQAFGDDVARDASAALIGLLHDHPELLASEDPATVSFLLAEEYRRRAGRQPAEVEPRRLLAEQLAASEGPVLAYFIGQDRSFAWILAGGETRWWSLPGRRALNDLLAPVLADMENPARPLAEGPARRLSTILLHPVMEYWPAGTTLRIIPDDILFAIPWSGLFLPTPAPDRAGELLLAHGPVVEAPALAALHSPRERARSDVAPGPGSLLAVGLNSDAGRGPDGASLAALRHAEAEVRQIANLWPGEDVELRQGAAAVWEEVTKAGLDRYRVIHIATHAVAHQGLPSRSTIRLAGGDGASQMTIPAIAGLDLDAELIYLSCCEASRRLAGAGSGLMDFASAFLAAGARSVIASTLRVDDEASRYLASRFYGHWLEGKSRAAALRAAQQDVRAATPRWRHPYFWAYYRLIGQPAD